MLQVVTHSLFISIVLCIWGLPILLLTKKDSYTTTFGFRSIIHFFCFLYFSGLITLSLLTSILCLFIPINFTVIGLSTVILIPSIVLKRKRILSVIITNIKTIKYSAPEIVFLIIAILTLLFLGTMKPLNGDTQIYHVQLINWIHQFGTVKGLANLFPRYGLGSNWFSLIAGLRLPGIFKYENFSWLNTTTVIWFFLWVFSNWNYHFKLSNNKTHKVLCHFYILIILFSLFEWELFRDAASSTNYDFIVTAIFIMAISFILESILITKEKQQFSFFLVLLCCSVIPFKLSGIFLFLLLLYYLFSYKQISYWVATFTIAIMVLVPLFIKNYLVTGYPLFPLSLSFGQPDWKLPESMTDYLRQYIFVTNRFYNRYDLNFSAIPEHMKEPWFKAWVHGLVWNQKLILIAAILSPTLLFLRNNIELNYRRFRTLFFLLLLMALGWFFTAPSPRFGYGVLLILAFLPVSYFIGIKLSTVFHKPILVIVSVVLCIYLFQKSKNLNLSEHLLHTAELDKPRTSKINLNGVVYYYPEMMPNGWMHDCFNTELPCISVINKFLHPRGSNLEDGFKLVGTPDSSFVRTYMY